MQTKNPSRRGLQGPSTLGGAKKRILNSGGAEAGLSSQILKSISK